MFRAKTYPPKKIYYTDNIRASSTNCMSGRTTNVKTLDARGDRHSSKHSHKHTYIQSNQQVNLYIDSDCPQGLKAGLSEQIVYLLVKW